MNQHRIGVLGSGSWATAIVKMLSENLETIHWMVKDEYTKGFIENHQHNPKYLSSVEFNISKLNITTDINLFFEACDIVIVACPSIYLKDNLAQLTLDIKEKIIFSAIKGIVPDFNDIVGNYLHTTYHIPFENIGALIGPCHAEEVAMERLSYLTIASTIPKNGEILAQCLNSDFIKTSQSDDILGTEYAAVLKNIFAIAAGLAHGLGFGDNFQAVLMSNAIREMEHFLNVIHPLARNINNSAYLGDLLVTGYSFFSRNRMLGNMIGKGYTVKSAILEMEMVAEGYYAAKGIYELAEQKELKMPITKAVYKILFEGKNPQTVFDKLSDKLN